MVTAQTSANWYTSFHASAPTRDIYICLDADHLQHLGQSAQVKRFAVPANKLLRLVEVTVPSLGNLPELRAYLDDKRTQDVALVHDGLDCLFRFVPVPAAPAATSPSN